MNILPYIFLVFQLLFALLFLYLCLAFATGAPYVPSTNPVSEEMIRLAHLKKGMRVYDLGSGDGKLLFLAARSGADATGFEINPYLVALTRIKSLFHPARNLVHVSWKNFWRANLADADVVFIYLLPWKMDRLENKILRACKPKTVIISNSFIFPHIPCTDKNERLHVYQFTIPKTTNVRGG